MFALSFGKLLVLGIVIFAVWTLWRRIDAPPPRKREPAGGSAVDLVRCPVCSVFVSAQNPRGCGRGDCPTA